MNTFQVYDVTDTTAEQVVARCSSALHLVEETRRCRLDIELLLECVDELSFPGIDKEQSCVSVPPLYTTFSHFDIRAPWLIQKVLDTVALEFEGRAYIVQAKLYVRPQLPTCIYCGDETDELAAHLLVCKLDYCNKCLLPIEEGDHTICNMPVYRCETCNAPFGNAFRRAQHQVTCTGEFQEIDSAIGGRLKIY